MIAPVEESFRIFRKMLEIVKPTFGVKLTIFDWTLVEG